MGTYGILRISYPLLPDMARAFALYAAIFGLVSIIYGALCAMAQTDLKKLIAYSSISHMGFVMLGMSVFSNTTAINGAVLQMFNHGTVTAMLFLLVGVIYDRAHIRDIDGLAVWPRPCRFMRATPAWPFLLPGAAWTIQLHQRSTGAGWFLPAVQNNHHNCHHRHHSHCRLFSLDHAAHVSGAPEQKVAELPEISLREAFTLTPLALIVILLGFYPMPVLDLIGTTLKHTVAMVVG